MLYRLVSSIITAISSPTAMLLNLLGTLVWFYYAEDIPSHINALLSGGALLFGQALYHESRPRDEAMHDKLDSMIAATNADTSLIESEESSVAGQQ